MVTVEQVPYWAIFSGIGHAVRGGDIKNGPVYTACNSLMYTGIQKEIPKRICRKCRQRLKEATLTGAAAKK